MTGLPQCDNCTPLGFAHHQPAYEMALYMPQFGEWLCAHCRMQKGIKGVQMVVPGIYRPGDSCYIEPGSAEHSAMISPSKVPSILNISRWESAYTLWHRMKGLVGAEPPQDAFDIGHDLEPYAANRWRRKNPGWRLSESEVQWVLPFDQFGFPVVATVDRRATRGRARRCVELKRALTMSDLEQWGDDLTGDLPEDYAAQVTAQMMFSGLTKYPGHCVAVGPYYQDRIYDVDYAPTVADWMVSECRQFWQSLHAEVAPPLDNSTSTYQTVRELHPDIDPGGSTSNLDPGDAWELLAANAELKAAEFRLRAAKTRVLDHMKRAQYAEVGEYRVAERRDNGKGGVSFYLSKTTTAADIESLRGTT